MAARTDAAERFWKKVDRRGPAECWAWRGAVGRGYGHVDSGGHSRYAHRVAYELAVGPIPQGLTIDHLCRNPLCVNPSHLEAVTKRENTLRGTSLPARRARQTHCKNGHPFDAENTIIDRLGRRTCRMCKRAYENARNAERGVR